jgi:hypothetical protein
MIIEQKTDRNTTTREDPRMTDMTDLKRAFVADHIADLEREGAALRAERVRDHLRAAEAPPGDRAHAAGDAPRRVRIGQWLVSVGEAIAGTDANLADTRAHDDGPCDDGPSGLSRAA